MPSSTSSSNMRIPDARYGWLWFMAVIFFALMIIVFEGVFRWQGHQPTVVDSSRFWAIHRADVYATEGKKRIVIAGASRAQLGLVPSVIEEFFPRYDVKQLTIDGTPAFEIIRDLCEDLDFNGLILWSATASSLLPPKSDDDRKAVIYTQFYHDEFWLEESIEKNFNCLLGAYLQSHLVTLSPNLTLKKILRARLRPKPIYLNMDFNRYRPARYYSVMTKSERIEHKRKRIERISANTETMDIVKFSKFIKNDLAPLHRLLRSKGGELVLLRMPTTGEHWSRDNDSAPKELFWDHIADISEILTIHFRDYLALTAFDCPDTSHLDATDAPEFTRSLSQILKNKVRANE